MKDKNIVMLEGLVGNDLKRGTASNGKKFITFSLCINSYMREIHDSTESEHPMAYLRVFIYDQRMLRYLNDTNIKHNDRVSIFGRLHSKLREVGKERIVQMNIVVRDISLIKKNANDDGINTEVPDEDIEDID